MIESLNLTLVSLIRYFVLEYSSSNDVINRWESQDSLEYDDSFKGRKASKELI